MKNDPRQVGFPFPEPANDNAAGATLDVDYSQMKVGSSAGNKRVVVKCDKCGKSAIEAHNNKNLRWIHSEVISLNKKNYLRGRTVSSCKVERFGDGSSTPK